MLVAIQDLRFLSLIHILRFSCVHCDFQFPECGTLIFRQAQYDVSTSTPKFADQTQLIVSNITHIAI